MSKPENILLMTEETGFWKGKAWVDFFARQLQACQIGLNPFTKRPTEASKSLKVEILGNMTAFEIWHILPPHLIKDLIRIQIVLKMNSRVFNIVFMTIFILKSVQCFSVTFCDISGECFGPIVGNGQDLSLWKCHQKCQDEIQCNFYSSKSNGDCLLFSSCEITLDEPQVLSGSKGCIHICKLEYGFIGAKL